MSLNTPFWFQQFRYANGAPLVGGNLYTYFTETTTPKAIFYDDARLIACPNPLPLDDSGFLPQYYLGSGYYTFILKDKDGNTIAQRDNIEGAGGYNHNELGGLQGGTSGQYYHLTSAQYYNLSGYLPLSGGTLTGELSGTNISISGTNTANSFVVSGGTSAQFLKADGSLDSNAYMQLTDMVGDPTYHAIYSSAVSANSTNHSISWRKDAGTTYINGRVQSGLLVSGVPIAYASSQGLTVDGILAYTGGYFRDYIDTSYTAFFAGGVFAGATDYSLLFDKLRRYSYLNGYIKSGLRVNGSEIAVATSTGLTVSGGIITTGGVSAQSFVKSGGTSAQFLKADGSVDSNSYIAGSQVSGTSGEGAIFSGTNTITSNSGWKFSQNAGFTWRAMLDGSVSINNTELMLCGRNLAGGRTDLAWYDGYYNPGVPTKRMTGRWNSTSDQLEFFSSEDNGTDRSNRLVIPRSDSVDVSIYKGLTINQNASEIIRLQRGGVSSVGTLGGIDFQMYNNAFNYVNYARIQSRIESNSGGAHRGSLQFKIYSAGSESKIVDILDSGINIAVGSLQISGTNTITSARGGDFTSMKVGSSTGFVRSNAGIYSASPFALTDLPAIGAYSIIGNAAGGSSVPTELNRSQAKVALAFSQVLYQRTYWSSVSSLSLAALDSYTLPASTITATVGEVELTSQGELHGPDGVATINLKIAGVTVWTLSTSLSQDQSYDIKARLSFSSGTGGAVQITGSTKNISTGVITPLHLSYPVTFAFDPDNSNDFLLDAICGTTNCYIIAYSTKIILS